MKIIIIGAGASGITAGHLLAQKDIEFEILEASAVHGGRLKKIDGFADFPIDLGAEWVHKWIKANSPLTEGLLAGNHPTFTTFQYKPQTYSLWKFGRLWKINFLRFLVPDDDKFIDSTWFDFFDQLVTPSLKERIRYNSPVKKINYGDEGVLVTTTSGQQYEADKVLVTVPIKLLQQGFITFEPPLPDEKMKAIHKEYMPDGLKVFIEFSKRFYPDMLFIDSILYNVTRSYGYYDATLGKKTSKNVLGLLVEGKRATKITSLKNDDAVLQYVLNELDEIFDGQATNCYVKHVVQNWSKEPFIQGTYSHRKSSTSTLAKPIANRLYFAGEAMNSKGNTIAVHGASESSYFMVDKMLKNDPANVV